MRNVCWRLIILGVAAATLFAGRAHAQSVASSDTTEADTTAWGTPVELERVVVTATRSQKRLGQVPVPTSVIDAGEIEARGVRRLSDLLAEQPGIQLNYDHGAGVQVQGFDADYTLILIDGEPVIGRTAGTLNLDRITVADVEQVEVVRGPSSSLYGSEALAGVINVITKEPSAPLEGTVQAQYGTHNTSDASIRVAGTRGDWRGKAFVSRYASDGYTLTSSATPTTPSFTNYVARSTLGYALGTDTDLEVRGRLAHEDQSRITQVQGNETQRFDSIGEQTDWSLTPTLTHTLRPGTTLELSAVASGYRTETRLVGQGDGLRLNNSRFNQQYRKGEAQLQTALGDAHLATVGAGYIRESVDADRVTGHRTGGFVFVQDEWTPTDWLDLVPSARLDAHSDYATRISPKLAALVRPVDGLRVRASVGSGYKAPAFRQLYLNFTNAQAGYTVFGAEEVRGGLDSLDANNEIAALLQDPSTLGGAMDAERSVAYNVGVRVDLPAALTLDANLYHNEVRDLIDTQPVARKTNGQQVFTYFNRGRVFTQGLEAELTWQPHPALDAAISYTYLNAKDRDVLNQLEDGRIFRRTDAGRDVAVPVSDYAGLRGRSRHRATVRFTARAEGAGFTASIRGRYRSRYGFSDVNGNGIVDTDAEYAPGYAMLDLTLTQTLVDDVALQIGANNLTDYTNAQYTPEFSGRTWFVGMRATL